MERALRPLAIGALVFQVVAALLTLPPGIYPPPLDRQFSQFLMSAADSLTLGVVTITATLLAFVIGALALVAARQRKQSTWFIAFLSLLLLSAYSPLIFFWLRMTQTPIYNPTTFTVNPVGYFLIELLPQIFSSILAIVALVYTARYHEKRALNATDGRA